MNIREKATCAAKTQPPAAVSGVAATDAVTTTQAAPNARSSGELATADQHGAPDEADEVGKGWGGLHDGDEQVAGVKGLADHDRRDGAFDQPGEDAPDEEVADLRDVVPPGHEWDAAGAYDVQRRWLRNGQLLGLSISRGRASCRIMALAA